MSLSVYLAFAAWIVLAAVLFATGRSRRAVLVALTVGTLFLPIAGLPFIGLKSKLTLMCSVLLIFSVLRDSARWLALRPRGADIAIAAWCIWPFISSLSNDLGFYDGISASFYTFIAFGVPYLLGRVYCASDRGLESLGRSFVAGGLVYIPLCLWEVTFSPQLHRLVYGFHQHSFVQTLRFGGFRPTVFMDHGLMVAMWVASATVIAFWSCLYRRGSHILALPMWLAFAMLLLTTVLCKSLGALLLLGGGLTVVVLLRWTRSALPLTVLLLLAPAYVAARLSGAWSGKELAEISADIGDKDRGDSLRFRLQNEERLMSRALERPITGWAWWGRFLVRDEAGQSLSVPDGYWIIAFGQAGLVGLAAFVSLLVGPVVLLLRRVPVRLWTRESAPPIGGLGIVLALFSIDCLFNGMINPLFFVTAGALAGFPRAAVADTHIDRPLPRAAARQRVIHTARARAFARELRFGQLGAPRLIHPPHVR